MLRAGRDYPPSYAELRAWFRDDDVQGYLDEFAFRFNRRRSEFRSLLFRRLLEQAVQVDPVNVPIARRQSVAEADEEIEAALDEVLAHVRGEAGLPCRIIDDPAAEHVLAIRKRMKLSRQKFADRFGLDARAVQEWEQGRRVPDRAARILLTVIDRDPEAVVRVLSE